MRFGTDAIFASSSLYFARHTAEPHGASTARPRGAACACALRHARVRTRMRSVSLPSAAGAPVAETHVVQRPLNVLGAEARGDTLEHDLGRRAARARARKVEGATHRGLRCSGARRTQGPRPPLKATVGDKTDRPKLRQDASLGAPGLPTMLP